MAPETSRAVQFRREGKAYSYATPVSVTITISKALLEDNPDLSYQLFNLSRREEERPRVVVHTPRGYYRELTDLLDLYHLPYQVSSPQDLSRLHILILEAGGLALELKEQLEVWGFSSVETARDYAAFRQREKRKIALALLDAQTLNLLPIGRQLHLLVKLRAVPLIVLRSYARKQEGRLWRLLKYPRVLQKPFSAAQLREAMERRLDIALRAQTDKNP